MIYISSSCVKNKTINASVEELSLEGYKNIELSGGTLFYDAYLDDLLKLKDRYQLNYLVHNYFPPPKDSFILNISSLNDVLYQRSIEHCLHAIEICKLLGSKKYAIHAGFLIDFSPEEAGKMISLRKVNDRNEALKQFANAWELISQAAGEDVKLYVENNVLSQTNYSTYKSKNPFFLTDYDGYMELLEKIDLSILLDLAHLKVSCKTLGLNFNSQSNQIMKETDYLHISGNDGLHDQNHGVSNDLEIMHTLENGDLSGKTMTLEVYSGLDSIRSSYDNLEVLQNNKQ